MNKTQKRRLLRAIISVVILLFGAYVLPRLEGAQTNQATVPSGYYRVTEFNDGDTITVDMAGQQEKIRMIGVDTPETQDPRKPVQCFGKAASNFTQQLIGESPVRLEADPQNTNRDRYNRLLRYVYLPDGRLVNRELIAQGYGFAYTSFPFSYKEEFRELEAAARQTKQGLWSECQPEKNQYGGYTTNPENN